MRFTSGRCFSKITLQSGTELFVCQQVNDRLHFKCWPARASGGSAELFLAQKRSLLLWCALASFHWVSELKLSTTLTADCAFHKNSRCFIRIINKRFTPRHRTCCHVTNVATKSNLMTQSSWCVLLTDRTRQDKNMILLSTFSNDKIKVGLSISLTYSYSRRPYITIFHFI